MRTLSELSIASQEGSRLLHLKESERSESKLGNIHNDSALNSTTANLSLRINGAVDNYLKGGTAK